MWEAVGCDLGAAGGFSITSGAQLGEDPLWRPEDGMMTLS